MPLVPADQVSLFPGRPENRRRSTSTTRAGRHRPQRHPATARLATPTDILLRSAAVRSRYGNCSDMWLHRRLNDDFGFPKPIYLGRLRYWRLSDLIAWEKSHQGGEA